MQKQSLILATALVSALAAGPVLAQSSSSSTTAPTHTTTTTTNTTSSSSMNTTPAKFWTQDNGNEWRTSKLKGLNVYNQNNDKLGDIEDILVDKSGQIKAVVIGVGGFLGLGEHNVAVPFDQLQFVNTSGSHTVAANTTTTGNPTATGAATTGLGSPAAPANTATTTNSTGTMAANNRNNNGPDRAILNATKDQLKAAPQFKYNNG
jgi:sporulation protein YlmC with PRC-barrel domain